MNAYEEYNLADDYLLRVDQYINENDFVNAKRLLIELLEIEPDLGRAHNLLGWIYFQKLDKYKLAEYHFKLANQFDPELPFAYRNMIYLLSFLNRNQELVEYVDQCIDVAGLEKDVLYAEQGLAYEWLGQYDNAHKAYTLARKYAVSKERLELLQAAFSRLKDKASWYNSGGFLRRALALF